TPDRLVGPARLLFGGHGHLYQLVKVRPTQEVDAIGPTDDKVLALHRLAIEVEHPSKQVVVAAAIVKIVRSAPGTQIAVTRPLRACARLVRRLPRTIACGEDIFDTIDYVARWVIRSLLTGDNLDTKIGGPFADSHCFSPLITH